MRTDETSGRNAADGSSERFQIAAAVNFQWRAESGAWHDGRGVTRYISNSSVFVLAYPVPVPGATIQLSLEIPPTGTLLTAVVLHGHGVVTELEPEEGQPIGFAASLVLDDDADDAEHQLRPAADNKFC